jgi:K+-sensing histidine kinase KdpD
MGKPNPFQSEHSIVREISSVITSTNSFDLISRLVLDLILSFTNAASGSILLLGRSNSLITCACKNMSREMILIIETEVSNFIRSEKIIKKKAFLINTVGNTAKTGKTYEDFSFICFPILIKDTLLGVININSKAQDQTLTVDDLAIINILTAYMAISIERSNLVTQLNASASELDELSRYLIDADRLKTEFMAEIAHDLRTPLNAIKGAIFYLKENRISKAEQREFIEILSDETSRMIDVIDDLLNFSPFKRNEFTTRKRILNLKDILGKVVSSRLLKNIFENSKLTVNISCPDSLIIVGEKRHLFQFFVYIFDVISKYAKAGDTVEIKAARTNRQITLKLQLKNRAIPDQDLPLISEEQSLWYGTEVDSSKLSFYLAQKTLELHGGSVHAINKREGLSMNVSFPVDRVEFNTAKVNELINHYTSFIATALNVDKCSIMLSDHLTDELTVRGSIGIYDNTIHNTSIKIGDKIAGRVAAENKPLLVQDIEKDPRTSMKNSPRYSTGSFLCMPVSVKDKTVGVLNLSNKTGGQSFSTTDMYIASAISDRISYIIEKAQDEQLSDYEFENLIKGLEALNSAESKLKSKNGGLSDIIFDIMKHMEQKESSIKMALYTSRLYDLGLTQIDEHILTKTGELTGIEKRIIRTHPFPAVNLIERIEVDDSASKIIMHHHESYDGSGYPDGLSGNDIPFISRVLAVADSYSAMTSDRPYRKALTKREAIKEINAGAGTKYDPDVISAFTQVV